MYKILKSILEGLQTASDKIQVIDHTHIIYVPSTIEICMKGNETVFSRGDKIIGTGDDLDDKELRLIFAIRGVINPHDDIVARREKMVEYFTAKEVAPTPESTDKPTDYIVEEDEEPFDL